MTSQLRGYQSCAANTNFGRCGRRFHRYPNRRVATSACRPNRRHSRRGHVANPNTNEAQLLTDDIIHNRHHAFCVGPHFSERVQPPYKKRRVVASVAVLETIRKFATNSSLSHALDYHDSRTPAIKFQFLLRFKSVVWSFWIANNTGWHNALLCLFGGSAVASLSY